jgi:tRNA (mo5U34)-methyltransferase
MGNERYDRETIRARMQQVRHWYHRIALAPGLLTPGTHASQEGLAQMDRLGLPEDASGLRVLDIGCRDGFFAFEMERRGAAEVVGIDYAAPEVTGFSVAAEILGSAVTYRVENVYDLSLERHGSFDLVLFLGVIYHLRNPLLALDRIREVIRPGGLLFVESYLTRHPALENLDQPAWEFYPGDSLAGDATNKWGPNLSGLKAVVVEAQFEINNAFRAEGRGYVSARAGGDGRRAYFRALDASAGLLGRAR